MKIALLATVLLLTACTRPVEEWLVGQWEMERIVEAVTEVGTGVVSRDTLMTDNYTRRLEFLGNATCLMTERDETTLYQWSVTDGNILDLWRDGWAEDYIIKVLNDRRLVYADSYDYYDSIRQVRYEYMYRYEYKRL